MMKTQVIGLKEFRTNITSLWKQARKKKVRYIVMHHSMPIFEVNPIMSDQLILEDFAQDVVGARKDVAAKKTYTTQQIIDELTADE